MNWDWSLGVSLLPSLKTNLLSVFNAGAGAGALLLRKTTATATRIKTTTPPTAPPMIAPVLELSLAGAGVVGGSVGGGGGGGGGTWITWTDTLGGSVTVTAAMVGLASLLARAFELMFCTACSASFLLFSMVMLVDTSTWLPLDSSRR